MGVELKKNYVALMNTLLNLIHSGQSLSENSIKTVFSFSLKEKEKKN